MIRLISLALAALLALSGVAAAQCDEGAPPPAPQSKPQS